MARRGAPWSAIAFFDLCYTMSTVPCRNIFPQLAWRYTYPLTFPPATFAGNYDSPTKEGLVLSPAGSPLLHTTSRDERTTYRSAYRTYPSWVTSYWYGLPIIMIHPGITYAAGQLSRSHLQVKLGEISQKQLKSAKIG